MSSKFPISFASTVVLPLFLASLSVVVLTFDLLDRVSTGVNFQDHKRTSQIVDSAFGAIQKQLANTAIDNAYWDDAVRNLYGTPNIDWMNETFAAATEIGVNYDASFVFDRDIPEAVAGFRRGQVFLPAAETYFGGKLNSLLDLLPRDTKTHDSKASIIDTSDGLAVVAASPILRNTEQEIGIPAAKPRYLVLLKSLTPEYLEAIGSQYVIPDLRLTAAGGPDTSGKIVKDILGAPVATVTWTDRRPGDVARTATIGTVVVVLGFLTMVMVGIGFLCWRLIRDLARREASARHDALHDALTALPNRAAFYAEIEKLSAGGKGFAVAFADLDGFKEVNDTYDHETGDRLIREMSALITDLTSDTDLVFRHGGDEFVVLFPGSDAEERARCFASIFIKSLRTAFDLDGKMASIGVSIGIAVGNEARDAQEVMRRADIAMYKAKAAGKNRYCVFVPQFGAERSEELDIANKLRQILADGSIEVAFQPTVDALTSAIVGVEVLARWPFLSPRQVTADRFIRVAERCGLIDDLGDAILAKACAYASQWPDISMSVNISPLQLNNPEFVSRTLRTIAENGMDCSRVELEITEGALVADFDRAKHIFADLRMSGVRIALDDFGSGFASIGYLKQLNFNRIKIDRSIVEQIMNGSAEQKVVQGTVLIAMGLAAAVTAEGVTNEEQAILLRLTGCTEMQGFYFYKPLPAEAISRLLSTAPVAVDTTAAQQKASGVRHIFAMS